MIKSISHDIKGRSSIHPSSSLPSSIFIRGECGNFGWKQSVIVSDGILDTLVSMFIAAKVIDNNRIMDLLTTYSVNELRKYIYTVDNIKSLRCCMYYTTVFCPSSIILSSLKFELLNYSIINHFHTLKLRCVTFQEQDALSCVYTVSQFMLGYIKRPTSVYPICRWRFCGSPSQVVTWVVSFPQIEIDATSCLRSNILRESWNDFYSSCNWCSKRLFSPSYLDYVLRVTGGFSLTKKIKSLSKKRVVEMDDVVFDKYSDKDTKYTSMPVLPIVLIFFSVLLLLSVFCFIVFIFPMIKKYVF